MKTELTAKEETIKDLRFILKIPALKELIEETRNNGFFGKISGIERSHICRGIVLATSLEIVTLRGFSESFDLAHYQVPGSNSTVLFEKVSAILNANKVRLSSLYC